jgi:hypothetical protein
MTKTKEHPVQSRMKMIKTLIVVGTALLGHIRTGDGLCGRTRTQRSPRPRRVRRRLARRLRYSHEEGV